MSDQIITVYGTVWCGDCRRARRFLDENQIAYQWVNIDQDTQGEQYVLSMNKGNRSVPTILFPDGSILVEPSTSQLSKKFNIPQPV